jgi:hypothetical protein
VLQPRTGHGAPQFLREGYQTTDHLANDRRDLLTAEMRVYTSSGIIGRPSLGSADKGTAVLDSLSRSFARVHDLLEGMTPASAHRRPHRPHRPPPAYARTVTYFPDLTPYSYLRDNHRQRQDQPWPDLPLLNIGWLDAVHPFPTGECPDGLIPALTRLSRVRVQQTRGYHFCELCLKVLPENAHDRVTLTEQVARGSAEFRVPGRGVVYAVPELITHYVQAHSYLPPTEFCLAALAAP